MKRVSGYDAFLLYSEVPNVHMHTLKIAIVDASSVDGGFTFDLFCRTLQQRLPLLAPLRYQLVDTPLRLHHPMWLEDCDVDLDYHARRVPVPSPGGRRELDRLIGEIASTPLDRSRPLWELYFADGMAGDKVALIGKVHHALGDGGAAANLMRRVMDPATPTVSDGALHTCAPPSTGQLLRAAGRDHLRQIRKLPGVLKYTASGVARVRRSKQRGQHPAFGRPFDPPSTFMNHALSPVRTFGSATLSLAQVKQTSKHLGITINDLVLAISAGALRELLLGRDGTADQPLIASVPVNIDPSPDRISGNVLGAMFVSLPVHIGDRLERVRLTGAATRVAKENYLLLGPEIFVQWWPYLPPPVAPPALRWLSRREEGNRLYNLVISNVPGPRERGRFAGATISEFYSVGPVWAGSGLNITVWSYVDQLNICVIADDRTMDDPHEATDAMIHEFAEIRRAAGLPSDLAHVDTAMAQTSATG